MRSPHPPHLDPDSVPVLTDEPELPHARDTAGPGPHSPPGRLPEWARDVGDAGDLEIPGPYRSERSEPIQPRVSNRKKLLIAGVAVSALAVGGLGAAFIIVVSKRPVDEAEAQLKQIKAGKDFMGCANAQGVIEKVDPPKTVLELKQLQSFGCQAYVAK